MTRKCKGYLFNGKLPRHKATSFKKKKEMLVYDRLTCLEEECRKLDAKYQQSRVQIHQLKASGENQASTACAANYSDKTGTHYVICNGKEIDTSDQCFKGLGLIMLPGILRTRVNMYVSFLDNLNNVEVYKKRGVDYVRCVLCDSDVYVVRLINGKLKPYSVLRHMVVGHTSVATVLKDCLTSDLKERLQKKNEKII